MQRRLPWSYCRADVESWLWQSAKKELGFNLAASVTRVSRHPATGGQCGIVAVDDGRWASISWHCGMPFDQVPMGSGDVEF